MEALEAPRELDVVGIDKLAREGRGHRANGRGDTRVARDAALRHEGDMMLKTSWCAANGLQAQRCGASCSDARSHDRFFAVGGVRCIV